MQAPRACQHFFAKTERIAYKLHQIAMTQRKQTWQLCVKRGVRRGVNGCGHVVLPHPPVPLPPMSPIVPRAVVPLSPTCFATLPGSRIPILITSTGAMSPYSSQNIHPWLQYTDNFITFKGCAPNGLQHGMQEQSESQIEGKNPICSHVAMSYFPMSPSPCVSPRLQFRKRESVRPRFPYNP